MKKRFSRRARRASTRRNAEAARTNRVPRSWEHLRDRRLVDLTVADLFDMLDTWRAELQPCDRENVFVTAHELADALGVKPDTVRKWVTRWGAPHVRFGRQIRFNVDQVRRWCEERAEAAGSWAAVHAERAQRVGTVTTGDEGEGEGEGEDEDEDEGEGEGEG